MADFQCSRAVNLDESDQNCSPGSPGHWNTYLRGWIAKRHQYSTYQASILKLLLGIVRGPLSASLAYPSEQSVSQTFLST